MCSLAAQSPNTIRTQHLEAEQARLTKPPYVWSNGAVCPEQVQFVPQIVLAQGVRTVRLGRVCAQSVARVLKTSCFRCDSLARNELPCKKCAAVRSFTRDIVFLMARTRGDVG